MSLNDEILEQQFLDMIEEEYYKECEQKASELEITLDYYLAEFT